MTEVHRCDACGMYRRYMHNTFSLSHEVADPKTSDDAVDVIQSGELCDDCAREVAELIKEIRDQVRGQ